MFSANFTVTSNNYGVMHKVNPISNEFIEYAKKCKGTVLDIGSAYGVATIPILQESDLTSVIACDISKKHLEELEVKVNKIEKESKKKLRSRLTLLHQRFPDIELKPNSLDAILASHVLPFLSGREIENGIKKLANALKPDGMLFISSYTIYNKVMKDYIPTYEKRKSCGESWPGEIEDASTVWEKSNPLTAVLPHKLNHLEPSLIEKLLKENNFSINYLDFISLSDEIPNEMRLDGRETMGAIVTKRKV